jgi:hypothetical protein
MECIHFEGPEMFRYVLFDPIVRISFHDIAYGCWEIMFHIAYVRLLGYVSVRCEYVARRKY